MCFKDQVGWKSEIQPDFRKHVVGVIQHLGPNWDLEQTRGYKD